MWTAISRNDSLTHKHTHKSSAHWGITKQLSTQSANHDQVMVDLLHLSESGCNCDVTSHLDAMGASKNELQSMDELVKQYSKWMVVLNLSYNSKWYKCTCVHTQLLSWGSARIGFVHVCAIWIVASWSAMQLHHLQLSSEEKRSYRSRMCKDAI